MIPWVFPYCATEAEFRRELRLAVWSMAIQAGLVLAMAVGATLWLVI
jgi:hypothetical protein